MFYLIVIQISVKSSILIKAVLSFKFLYSQEVLIFFAKIYFQQGNKKERTKKNIKVLKVSVFAYYKKC